MGKFILFICSFIISLIIYELFIVKKEKKKEKSDKKPIEIQYLIKKYNVDLKKANYDQMLQIVSLVSSFDIALIVLVISFFERINIQLLVAFIMLVPTILISYSFVGNFYKKKGLIKNVQHKRNRK